MSEDKRMRLNIGAGSKILIGWTNIDKSFGFIEYDEKTDTRVEYGDATKLEYKDNVFDEIYACHVLDHLSRNKELDKALSEFHRVLKPGGILRVAVSDFEKVVKMYQAGIDLEELWGGIVGGHKDQFDRHGCIFDFRLLKRHLENHGFVCIKGYDWREFLPKDFQDNSCACIPKWDINGYPMSLNVVCLCNK